MRVLRRLSPALAAFLVSCGSGGEPSGNPVPTITGIARDTATIGGTPFNVVLNTTGTVTGASATFDGSARTTAVGSGGVVTMTLIAGDLSVLGDHEISVVNPEPEGGPSAPVPFHVLPAPPVPTLDSISPDSVIVGGASFTLHAYGTGFTARTTIRVNGTSVTTARVDSGHVTWVVPALSICCSVGTINISVQTPTPGGGLSVTKTLAVRPAIEPPLVTGIDPDTIIVGPDTIPVTIHGHYLQATDSVRIENQAVVHWYVPVASTDTTTTISLDRTWLNGLGLFSVTVASPGGLSTTQYYEMMNPLPVVTSATPDTVDATKGADTIIVNGSGFVPGMVVRLPGLAELQTTRIDFWHLRAIVPASVLVAGGVHPFVVFDPLEYRASDTLQLGIRSPVPVADSIAGPGYTLVGNTFGTISLYGTGFVYAAEFLVNGQSRPVGEVFANRVTLGFMPEDVDSARTLNIQYHSFGPGGGTTTTLTHQVVEPYAIPTITGADRTLLVADSGDLTLTLHGHGFLSGGVVELAAGEYDYEPGDTLATTWVNDSVVTAVIPAARLGQARPYWFRARSPQPTLGPSNAIMIAGASPGLRQIGRRDGVYMGVVAHPDSAKIWATVTTNGQFAPVYLVAIDPVTMTATDSVRLFGSSRFMTISSDGSAIYVATGNGTIEEYDTSTLTLTRTIPLGNTPDGVPWEAFTVVAARAHPGLIAAVKSPTSLSSSGYVVFLVDHGTILPGTYEIPGEEGGSAVAFTPGDSLLVSMPNTITARVRRLSVDSNGVGAVADTTVQAPGATGIVITGTTVHTGYGVSFDLMTGTPLADRSYYPSVAIGSGQDPHVAYELSYGPSSYVLHQLEDGSGTPSATLTYYPMSVGVLRNIVRWGADGFAVAGESGLVVGRSSVTEK